MDSRIQATLGDLLDAITRLTTTLEGRGRESLVLEPAELVELTGYKMAARQLVELHRAGFHRARIGMAGRVILERSHYQAVCSGQVQREKPKMRPFNPSR